MVDLEKKGIVGTNKKASKLLTGNLEGRLLEIIDRKKIIGIRYDSLTSEHVLNLIIKINPFLYKTKIGIVGLGKIGFKIAMSLLECGNNIEIYTRDYETLYKKCTCMDVIKPQSTFARPIPHRTLEACIHKKDIIITATTSQNIINEKSMSSFLIFDKTMPKSLVFCINEILDNLKLISRSNSRSFKKAKIIKNKILLLKIFNNSNFHNILNELIDLNIKLGETIEEDFNFH